MKDDVDHSRCLSRLIAQRPLAFFQEANHLNGAAIWICEIGKWTADQSDVLKATSALDIENGFQMQAVDIAKPFSLAGGTCDAHSTPSASSNT